jgi:hypothetical protein
LRFWDTSALVPLLIQEPFTTVLKVLLEEDPEIVVWWGTSVEIRSAISRSLLEGRIQPEDRGRILASLGELEESVFEIRTLDTVRTLAIRLLEKYPNLRAADALQLAAAKLWSLGTPERQSFVCLDRRLRQAAEGEQFSVQPGHFDPA